MQHLINCQCGEAIVKSLDEETKIRSKVLVFKDGEAFAVCKSCGKDVKVPLKLDEGMLKSMASAPRKVNLYIRNMK